MFPIKCIYNIPLKFLCNSPNKSHVIKFINLLRILRLKTKFPKQTESIKISLTKDSYVKILTKNINFNKRIKPLNNKISLTVGNLRKRDQVCTFDFNQIYEIDLKVHEFFDN